MGERLLIDRSLLTGEADRLWHLLRAIRGVSGLRDPDRFPSWLYAIANNVLRDFVRDTSRKRREARDFEAEPIDPRDERPSADRHEDLELALEAVLDLPERYREPMLLRHVDDLSYEEISAILRVSPNAVQVRISRARDRLRKSAVYRRLYESPSTSSSNEGRESAEIIELEARRRSFDTDETESQKTKRPLEK